MISFAPPKKLHETFWIVTMTKFFSSILSPQLQRSWITSASRRSELVQQIGFVARCETGFKVFAPKTVCFRQMSDMVSSRKTWHLWVSKSVIAVWLGDQNYRLCLQNTDRTTQREAQFHHVKCDLLSKTTLNPFYYMLYNLKITIWKVIIASRLFFRKGMLFHTNCRWEKNLQFIKKMVHKKKEKFE